LALAPTLVSYYADSGSKSSPFIKSVRTLKVEAFTGEDVEAARSDILNADPQLMRTAALAFAKNVPQCVERWAIDATQHVLRMAIPTAFVDPDVGAKLLLERIVDALAVDIGSKNKLQRIRGQNLLRLALNWLTKKRSLDLLDSLLLLSKIWHRSDTMGATKLRRNGERLLLRSKPGAWRDLVLVAQLSGDALSKATSERDEAIHTRNRAQNRINDLESLVEHEKERVEQLSGELGRLNAALAASRQETEELRQLRQLDLDEQKARQRFFLSGRLNLLASDARDALDFEPPHVDAARQRLDALKQTIAREVERLNNE
jgi:hypothetical protein